MRKLYRKRMWAVIGTHDAPLLYLTRRPARIAAKLGFGSGFIRVEIQELPPKKRSAK